MIESTGTTGFSLCAHRLEERRQAVEGLLPHGRGQTVENALRELILHGLEPEPSAAALVGELHLGGPAVFLIGSPPDEPGLLETGEVSSEGAGGDPEELSEPAEAHRPFPAEGFESRGLGYGHPAALHVGPLRDGKPPQQGGERAPEPRDVGRLSFCVGGYHILCIVQQTICKMQQIIAGYNRGMPVTTIALTNGEVAAILDEVGDLLEAQGAQPYRALAYHRAASSIRELPSPLADLVESGGEAALESLPGIGENLARRILEIVETGRLQLLERLRGEAEPEALFRTVPGIGPRLASEIHERLGIESLEELEMAAHDARLSTVPGFGPRRLRAVEESLKARLGRRSRQSRTGRVSRPAVAELLDVDEEYRKKAAEGALTLITPRRFNPKNEKWLPILHTRRGDRHYTAVFSNTARAHALGRTRDWVVLFHHEDDTPEGQATVVTEYRGPLAGRRVVRGREAETLHHYQK